MEKKEVINKITNHSSDLMDKHFPKGECMERGKALVFNAEMIVYVSDLLEQELDKAREEGKREKYDMFPKDLSEHFYFGELRHNSMCKFCTEAQDIIQSEEYKDKVKEILKQLYNEKILSNLKTKE